MLDGALFCPAVGSLVNGVLDLDNLNLVFVAMVPLLVEKFHMFMFKKVWNVLVFREFPQFCRLIPSSFNFNS